MEIKLNEMPQKNQHSFRGKEYVTNNEHIYFFIYASPTWSNDMLKWWFEL